MIHRHKIDLIATDGNYNYATMFPNYQKHIISKAETCLVEAKNSSLKDMLARLNRKTKQLQYLIIKEIDGINKGVASFVRTP